MAGKLGLDAAGMDGGRADSVPLVAAIELDCEQDVGGLRASVGDPRVIGRALDIRVVEIDVGIAMTGEERLTSREPGFISEAMRFTSTKWPRWLVPNWAPNVECKSLKARPPP
jgi:hypothetical protein